MKKKTSHAAQDAYSLLTPPTKSQCGRKVIITPTREVHIYESAESTVPPEIVGDAIFTSMDDFVSRGPNTVLAYHAEFLKCEPPKKQSSEITAHMTWSWFTQNGTPHLDGRTAEGSKERKSTIGSSIYSRGSEKTCPTTLPPQAKASWSLFERAAGDGGTVTEADLRKFVEAHAHELKTKQDPWRIFQYYRPQLIEAKLLRRS